jgi:hypothetical protein
VTRLLPRFDHVNRNRTTVNFGCSYTILVVLYPSFSYVFPLLALVHQLIIPPVNEHTLTDLFDNLSRRSNTPYFGQRVGPSWLKYEWNQTVWNLDDGNAFPPILSFITFTQSHQMRTTQSLSGVNNKLHLGPSHYQHFIFKIPQSHSQLLPPIRTLHSTSSTHLEHTQIKSTPPGALHAHAVQSPTGASVVPGKNRNLPTVCLRSRRNSRNFTLKTVSEPLWEPLDQWAKVCHTTLFFSLL